MKDLAAGGVNEAVVLNMRDARTGRSAQQEAARNQMRQLRSELEFFGFTVTERTGGADVKTINHVARQEDVSVIITGSSGRGDASNRQGSIAGLLIGASERPLLVVPLVDSTAREV